MMHTLLYSEMNQAVPGAPGSQVGHEGGGYIGIGECQVPSPSQWSDPCYSPPSFHSPQHLPGELEKVKEEPYSPASSYLSFPPSPPSNGMSTQHGTSPYARPNSSPNGPNGSPNTMVLKTDTYESCINLADLLSDNQQLISQHQTPSHQPANHQNQNHHYVTQQPQQQVSSPQNPAHYGGGAPSPYSDHPLLRGCLEETNSTFHQLQKMVPTPSPVGGSSSNVYAVAQNSQQQSHQPALEDHNITNRHIKVETNTVAPFNAPADGLSFLDTLVDVKQEAGEENVCTGSSVGSPAMPSPGTSPSPGQQSPVPSSGSSSPSITSTMPASQRDILETVEMLALEYNRMDVQRISESLNINMDPALWTVEDVRSWLKLQASQLNLPPLMLDFWNYGGTSLLKLTESQFRQLAPIGGELLYAKLEIWREAVRTSSKYSSPSSSPMSTSSPSSSPHHQHQPTYTSFFQQHAAVAAAAAAAGGINSPSLQDQHHLMVLSPQHAAHLHQLHQQQVAQQQQHISAAETTSSSNHAGTGRSSSPASPPMPLVPTPVAQVNQANNSTGSPSSPPSSVASSTGGVYHDDLDMSTLLQQGSPSVSNPQASSASSPHSGLNPHCPTHEDGSYESDDEVDEETCNTSSGGSGRGGTHIHLWQFLKELLQQPQLYGSCIRWLDRQKGIFKIEDSVRVARLWGKRKNRPAMNYDKLSRSIRQYYKKGIMKKTERSQRLVYQFCHPYSL